MTRREETGRVLVRRVLRSHRTVAELTALLPELDASPREVGTLRAVVRRPAPGEREVLEVGHLDVAEGLVGDTWAARGSRRTPDGSAHPDMQLNLMNHRLVEFLAQDPEREQLAGDQMFLDLDLSHDHLPAWSELHIGGPEGAVIVVTDQPHNGCGKFIARFGKDAMTFVNGPEGKPRRLRGLCARVVRPGLVRPGDEVRVVRPAAAPAE
ncbi:MOSC domain-containing protein [Nocardioides eburneiflavus]|uniref:MOSC domain-containing protein n=2 Tax=Nocardioides eburneiflavus TaxID=2518372 RepID=A0A4Z1CPI8_9ACTN|nr:MOSC domain-containing protein [Nocardioides eburneiflavus]